MGFRINTNIAAMDAHRNALMTNKGLDKSLSSLSSGLRINKAADDASGMTIADSLRSQAQGLGQAINNANDGVAVVQTADGALDEYIKIINSVRTKSIQASSDGQNADSRKVIQNDIDRLLEAANSIATQTQFNGQKLLDGTYTNKAFHIGAYAGETVSLSVGNVQTDAVGDIKGFTGDNTRATLTDANSSESASGRILKDGLLTVNGTDLSNSLNTLSPLKTTDAAAVAAAITDATGLIATGTNTLVSTATIAGGSITSTNNLLINGIAVADTTVAVNDADSALRNAINDISDQTGVTASVDNSGKLSLVSNDGSNISITTSSTQSAVAQVDTGTITGAITAGSVTATVDGVALGATAFNADHATTMGDLATAIAGTAGVASATYTAATANVTESNVVTFGALTAGQTLTIGGLIVTDQGAGATAAQVAAVFASLADGAVIGNDTANLVTSGTLSGWSSGALTGVTAVFTSATANTDVADLAIAGTGAGASSLVATQGSALAAEALVITGLADGTAHTVSIDTSAATGLTSITTPITTDGQAAITSADASSTVTGLTADHLTNQDSSALSTLTSGATASVVIAKGELIINGTDMAGTYGDNSTAGSAATDLETAIKAISGMENSSIDSLGVMKLVVNNGNDLNIAGTKAVGTGAGQFGLDNGIFNESKAGKVNIYSEASIKIAGTDADSFGLTNGTHAPASTGSSLSGSIDVTTREGAEVAILISDSALKQLDATRSDLGSVQNQLESTIRNISVTQVNVTSAESQIRDVDFAQESANFAKLNILAQSGSYAMSQANAIQQNVMRLLQ